MKRREQVRMRECDGMRRDLRVEFRDGQNLGRE